MATASVAASRRPQGQQKKQRASSAFYLFHILSIWSVLIRALTALKMEREEQRRRESEPQAPEFVRSRWCALIVLHQSDKWHNEATSLNVRAVSVSPAEGFCG